jgi:hypothetical protein
MLLLAIYIHEREIRWPRSYCALAVTEFKQCWSVIGWVIKNLLSRAPPCFGRHVKPLVPAAFAVVSTHQPALGPRGGLWPVLLMCNPGRKAFTPAVGTLIG